MITWKKVENKIRDAQMYKDDAEADGNSSYYYWEGYIAALEYVQDNLPITDDPKSVIDKDLEEAWWFAIK